MLLESNEMTSLTAKSAIPQGSPHWYITAVSYTGYRLYDAGAAQTLLSEGPAQCGAS